MKLDPGGPNYREMERADRRLVAVFSMPCGLFGHVGMARTSSPSVDQVNRRRCDLASVASS